LFLPSDRLLIGALPTSPVLLESNLGQGEDGYTVSISRLCRWLAVPRRTVYYRPSRMQPVLQELFTQPIKQMIEESPEPLGHYNSS